MSELNLKQIEDKLNNEFNKEERTLIFWYDDKKEFEEDIEHLKLENTKIHFLTPTNLFMTKVLLEIEDQDSNYLIYAPFKKPDNRNNHLADMILYSKEFFADRASLLAVDLGIDPVYKPVLEKYIRFFNAKDRTRRFYDLEVDKYDEKSIEISLLSVLTRSKIANFDEVVRIVLSKGLFENKYIKEFKKYNLDGAFWKYCNLKFSYKDEEPSLLRLSISLLLTYTKNQMDQELPKKLNEYILNKPGTVMTFVDQMMNSSIYKESFRSISNQVYKSIDGDEIFETYDVENLVNIDVFKDIDKYIIKWILDRLLDENINAEIRGSSIAEICKSRKFQHFQDCYINEYNVLINAYHLISYKDINREGNIVDLVKEYDKKYYKIDTNYRHFYYYLDKVDENSYFENLQELIENIYINKYLNTISKEFEDRLDYNSLSEDYKLQRDFYDNFVKEAKHRIIVIISDAFRYEIGKELVERFKCDPKTEASIEPQIGVLPSYTSLGMAALLPNKEIKISEDYSVYVDGKLTRSLEDRKAILQAENFESDAIQYDDLVRMKRDELSKFFTGKRIIYIYHNQIDARGDKLNTEDEVFNACQESMDEIEDMIKRLTHGVSASRFIITADHGFIYTRRKNQESDKIERFFKKEDKINRRFIISENGYEILGTKNIMVADVLDNYDERTITMASASNVFKAPGGGQNYFHGGSSPQEVILPVIQVKTIRDAVETENVKISLISMVNRINNLIFILDFVQQEPVSDVIKPTNYKIRFEDEDGELISNEENYLAKSKSKQSADRIFNLRFRLKNKKYNRDEKYYFIIRDIETGLEIYRQQVIIDIAFSDDYGFDI